MPRQSQKEVDERKCPDENKDAIPDLADTWVQFEGVDRPDAQAVEDGTAHKDNEQQGDGVHEGRARPGHDHG